MGCYRVSTGWLQGVCRVFNRALVSYPVVLLPPYAPPPGTPGSVGWGCGWMRTRMGSQLPVLAELLPFGVNNTRVVVHVSQLNG